MFSLGERGEGEERRMKETKEVKRMKTSERKQKKTGMEGGCEKVVINRKGRKQEQSVELPLAVHRCNVWNYVWS